MINIIPGSTASTTFGLSADPDELPTVTCYAGLVLLGDATVITLDGTNDYRATYTLPSSGIADGTTIEMRANATVLGSPVTTLHMIAGVLNYSAGITTLLSRITGLIRTKAEADIAHDEVISALGNVPSEQTVNVSVPAVTLDSLRPGSDTLIRYRGTRWVIIAEDVGDLDDAEKIYFTLKRGDEADEDAVISAVGSIPADNDDGLLVIGGDAAADSANASIETETANGENRIIVIVDAVATQLVPPGKYRYDIKTIGSPGPAVLLAGNLQVLADVTRAVS